jgi:hypothetical protein
METRAIEVDSAERGVELASFDAWLYAIVKGSFGTLTMPELNRYRDALREVFDTITFEVENGNRVFSSHYDRAIVEANIRKAFAEKRSYRTSEEVIPTAASLLNIANFTPKIYTEKPENYFPEQDIVDKIHLDDNGDLKPDKATAQMLEYAEANGMTDVIEMLKRKSHLIRRRTAVSITCPTTRTAALSRLFCARCWPSRSWNNLAWKSISTATMR